MTDTSDIKALEVRIYPPWRRKMTTAAAAAFYLAKHNLEMEGRGWAVFNPHGKPYAELPAIYGFNNGGSPGWYVAQLIAEDGTGMGSHICSHEGYMLHDLGILAGTRPDRHDGFRKHYPDGYRMIWVPSDEVKTHPGLDLACERNQAQREAAKTMVATQEQGQ